jgi:hypothetical protein
VIPRARRLLPPLGGLLAAGLTAAGLSSLAAPAQAAPEWARDVLSADKGTAYAVADFWSAAGGAALKKATQYTWDAKAVARLTAGGGDTADGKPGAVAPATGAKAATARARNVNLPRTVGKVFFLDHKGEHRWCSATSIQATYRNLVATAGHCVYDVEGNRDVMDKWVFVPGYYQGKAPWGVYVGQAAFTHYDFAVHEDFDHDYAFVAVYNGIRFDGGRSVTAAEYAAFTGAKAVEKKATRVSAETYAKWIATPGHVGEVKGAVASQTAGPDTKGAVYEPKEVDADAYEKTAAKIGDPSVIKIGAQAFTDKVVLTKEAHDAYAAKKKGQYWPESEQFLGTPHFDGKNWTLTRYYTKQWIIPGADAEYYAVDHVYVIEAIKDAGRLGDTVGGQGFAWNQKTGLPVHAFGYPGDRHPDGDKPFTGVTMKYCHGRTGTRTYASDAYKTGNHLALKCSMTGGADGGPWVLKYSNAKRLGYVNGVTSLFHDQDGNGRVDFVSSPYFGGDTADIYRRALDVRNARLVGDRGELLK